MKEIKGIKIGREKVRLSLYADNLILDIEKPKDYTQKLFKLNLQIQQSSRIQG